MDGSPCLDLKCMFKLILTMNSRNIFVKYVSVEFMTVQVTNAIRV